MTTTDIDQLAIVLACITDAALSAIDPSGAALRRAHFNLREGLRMAEQMDAADSPASEVVRAVVENLEQMETIH